MSKHTIVADFGDAEVRRKSGKALPKFFREWMSVEATRSQALTPWKRVPRVAGIEGYPPFDMFTDWKMDFATIAAGQLGRSDWPNFRRLLLVHVPQCPLFCWYCFNDAWEENDCVKTGQVEAAEIVDRFAKCRDDALDRSEIPLNVLRLS